MTSFDPGDVICRRNVLADGTAPGAAFTVQLQVGLEVEALDVFAVVPSRRQGHALEGDGAFQRYLRTRGRG